MKGEPLHTVVESQFLGRVLVSTIRLPDDGGEPNYETVKIHCNPAMQWSVASSHDRGSMNAIKKHNRFVQEVRAFDDAESRLKPVFWERVKAHGLMEKFEA